MAGPSAAVRLGLRTFAQDDRVGERWRRAIQGFLRCPFGFAQGPVEMAAFVGMRRKNGRMPRFFAKLRMTDLGWGWGERSSFARYPTLCKKRKG